MEQMKFHKQKLYSLILAGVAIISMLLPWFSVKASGGFGFGVSKNGFGSWGLLALIGAGVTALYAGPEVDAASRQAAATILSTCGPTVWVTDEAQLDVVTAVSGSGPAYFFLLIESSTRRSLFRKAPPPTDFNELVTKLADTLKSDPRFSDIQWSRDYDFEQKRGSDSPVFDS